MKRIFVSFSIFVFLLASTASVVQAADTQIFYQCTYPANGTNSTKWVTQAYCTALGGTISDLGSAKNCIGGELPDNNGNCTQSATNQVTRCDFGLVPNSTYTDCVSAPGNGNLPDYVPLEPLPGLTKTNRQGMLTTDFSTFINLLFKVMIAVGAIIAVGALVFSGVVYMVSGAVGTKSAALNRIQASLWGLLLLIASWLLLYTINPRLVGCGAGSNCPTATQTSPTAQPIQCDYGLVPNSTNTGCIAAQQTSSSGVPDCSKWGGGAVLITHSNGGDLQTYTNKCSAQQGTVRIVSTDTAGTSLTCDAAGGGVATSISCP